jgi:hypothetical protein
MPNSFNRARDGQRSSAWLNQALVVPMFQNLPPRIGYQSTVVIAFFKATGVPSLCRSHGIHGAVVNGRRIDLANGRIQDKFVVIYKFVVKIMIRILKPN